MNKLAPMLIVCLSAEALLTRMGLPYILIMLRTLMAYVWGDALLVAVEWEAGWESPCASIAHNIHSLHRLQFCTPQSHSPDVDL